jgi:hypothetical protein
MPSSGLSRLLVSGEAKCASPTQRLSGVVEAIPHIAVPIRSSVIYSLLKKALI